MPEHVHPELDGAKYVVFVDAARRYNGCSDDVCQLVGYDRTEILHMSIDELSFDRTSVPELFERYIRDGLQDGEYILKHKNGAPILIHYRSWVFSDGCHAATWEPAEEWEHLYLAALVETHPVKLRDKANAALTAIHKRQTTLGAGESTAIFQKLRDARVALRSLLQ